MIITKCYARREWREDSATTTRTRPSIARLDEYRLAVMDRLDRVSVTRAVRRNSMGIHSTRS